MIAQYAAFFIAIPGEMSVDCFLVLNDNPQADSATRILRKMILVNIAAFFRGNLGDRYSLSQFYLTR